MKLFFPWKRSSAPKASERVAAVPPEQQLKIVKDHWNRFNSTDRLWETGYINRAESEDAHYREGIWDFSYYILNPVVKFLHPTDSVLEIGVGLGRIIAYSARAFQKVYGIDISETVLQKASAYLHNQGIANVDLKPTTGDAIPLEDELIHYCYSYLVFQHIPSQAIVRNYVAEIYRVLKPKGICRIQLAKAQGIPHENATVDSNWTIDQRCTFDVQGAKGLFENAGFHILTVDAESADHPWSETLSKRQLWVTAQKP